MASTTSTTAPAPSSSKSTAAVNISVTTLADLIELRSARGCGSTSVPATPQQVKKLGNFPFELSSTARAEVPPSHTLEEAFWARPLSPIIEEADSAIDMPLEKELSPVERMEKFLAEEIAERVAIDNWAPRLRKGKGLTVSFADRNAVKSFEETSTCAQVKSGLEEMEKMKPPMKPKCWVQTSYIKARKNVEEVKREAKKEVKVVKKQVSGCLEKIKESLDDFRYALTPRNPLDDYNWFEMQLEQNPAFREQWESRYGGAKPLDYTNYTKPGSLKNVMRGMKEKVKMPNWRM